MDTPFSLQLMKAYTGMEGVKIRSDVLLCRFVVS